jgi:GTPase SAR1 family protein
LWRQRDFVLAATKLDSRALKQAAPELQADPEIVLAAAARNADEQLLRTATRRLNSCKVVVGGDGRVGKTSLLRCLRGESFREAEESTRGLASMRVDVRSVDSAGWQATPEGGLEAKFAGAVVRAEAASQPVEGEEQVFSANITALQDQNLCG